MALKIGLTGGIGSGKTTVAKIFELLDVPVYYADAAAKELYRSDLELMNSMKKRFGPNIYSGTELNRKLLASIVFNDRAKLELLNSLVHPRTIKHAGDWMQKQNAPYLLKEAALLFESGADKELDFIIGVSAPLELRINRAVQRDAISKEEVFKRLERQMKEDQKLKLCHYLIINDEAHEVIPQVMHLHQQFLAMAEKKSL